MAENNVKGSGTKEDPWVLQTPPGTSEYMLYRDETNDPPVLVCVVGKTTLLYDLRCIEDLHAMLKAHGDWIELGSADEQKPAKEGTVEAWGRSPDNPIGGWYGLKKGLRGRFGMYRPCSKHWGWRRWSINPKATVCGPCRPSQMTPATCHYWCYNRGCKESIVAIHEIQAFCLPTWRDVYPTSV